MLNPVFGKLKAKGLPPVTNLPDLNFNIGFVIKDWFFNSDNVKKRVRDIDRIVMAKFGGYTRAVARRSMKNVPESHGVGSKDYASAPGQPPHAHALDNSGTGGLKYGPSNIVFGFDPSRSSVVIGPRPKPGRNSYIPFKLEYGSHMTNVPNPRRKDRKVGDVGAIRVGSPRPGTEGKPGLRKIRAVNGHYYDVYFARIKTDEQLRRVETNETFLWGPKTIGSVTLAPRPYMRPAFWIAKTQLARFWEQARSQRVYYTGN